MTALEAYSQGPRVVQTQLCLTLSALALQLKDGEDTEWGDRVVGWMIDKFGKDAKDVGTLLEFLQVLPEEVVTNHRIPVDVSEARIVVRKPRDVLRLNSRDRKIRQRSRLFSLQH